MSGPIDFVVIFAIAKVVEMQSRRQAEAAARAEAVAEHLRANRERARQIMAEATRAAQITQKTAMDRRRERTAESLEAARRAAGETTAKEGAARDAADREQASRVEEAVQKIVGWQAALTSDQAVGSFRAAESNDWNQRAATLLSDSTMAGSVEDALARAESLTNEAEAIHRDAGEIKAEFDTRNELLQDIIGSLKEIGFYVEDPRYANPQDPKGPVIIKAVRGDEEMTASVDLSETVKSVWKGIADERCKERFFEYVDSMKSRGIDVKARRDDLKERPILKRKGANELPRSGSRGK